MRLGLSIGSRRVARRLATVDAYEFPSSVRRRVRHNHPDLRAESFALVETALRQWFRILARRPSARPAQPGLVCLHHLNAPLVESWVLRRPTWLHGSGGGCGGGGG